MWANFLISIGRKEVIRGLLLRQRTIQKSSDCLSVLNSSFSPSLLTDQYVFIPNKNIIKLFLFVLKIIFAGVLYCAVYMCLQICVHVCSHMWSRVCKCSCVHIDACVLEPCMLGCANVHAAYSQISHGNELRVS